jgi:formate dehydrogenase subunit gamma
MKLSGRTGDGAAAFTSRDRAADGILRFVTVERVAHWLYAVLFLICLVSGLLMWIPATREWMGGARLGVSQRHAASGFAMVIIPLLLMVLLDRKRLLSGIRQLDWWSADDRRWFWVFLRGGSLRGRSLPPQGRFNAGQKLSTILVAAMAVGFAVTGGILLGKADLPAWLVSRALWLHDFLAVASAALLAGHLVQALLTRHGRASLKAMLTGRLSEEVARERHALWWEQVVGTGEEGTSTATGGSHDG